MESKRKELENSFYMSRFHQMYGAETYQEIENQYGVVGKKVKLKEDVGEGTIIGLWLPADLKYSRKEPLWYIDWESGSNGFVELKDLDFV